MHRGRLCSSGLRRSPMQAPCRSRYLPRDDRGSDPRAPQRATEGQGQGPSPIDEDRRSAALFPLSSSGRGGARPIQNGTDRSGPSLGSDRCDLSISSWIGPTRGPPRSSSSTSQARSSGVAVSVAMRSSLANGADCSPRPVARRGGGRGCGPAARGRPVTHDTPVADGPIAIQSP
jgi:hypothetical protein